MRVLIYESSSKGGNYEYARALFDAYGASSRFSDVQLLLPSNTPMEETAVVRKVLLPDSRVANKWLNKIWLLLRSFTNPFILFFCLLRTKKTFVLFNDFEQISAPVWVVFFRAFLGKHRYAVFLHDPDRDRYPPHPVYSRYSMRTMMNLMDVGLYHHHLPEKPYYQNRKTKFLSVPHGLYSLPTADVTLMEEIAVFKSDGVLFTIVGNIRTEKNYLMAIHALQKLPHAKLIIAGEPSNASVDMQIYKQAALKIEVDHRIFWCIKYLEPEELSAVITMTDCVLLNYSNTFTSQSGIINMIAPFRKRIIVSDTGSALTKTVKRFNLGSLVKPDVEADLICAMESIISGPEASWDDFLEHASWETQVQLVAEAYEQL